MRKFMTTLLALVMLLSVAMPAFAAAATSPAELTEDASSVDIPIIYNIEYTAGEFTQEVKDKIDSENPSYRVVVSWTATPGTVTIPGTYTWDAVNAQYIVAEGTGDKTKADVTSNAVADIRIRNYSNAKVWYGVYGELEYNAEMNYPKAMTNYDESYWQGKRLDEDNLGNMLASAQLTLPSASAGVSTPGESVADSAIPEASGRFAFNVPSAQLLEMNEAQEKVATFTVSFYTSNPYT